MLCPECQKLGLKSKACPGPGTTTLMYCPPFYDEEGRLHDHDSNVMRQGFTCSRGHSWNKEWMDGCWCGWPDKGEYAE